MHRRAAPAEAGERPQPLQNRVTPFGEIVAVSDRGLFTGNRGIIHDPASHSLLARRWTTKAWLVCRLEYKGIRRTVMGHGWTELFFLDEATALAGGHRPCFACRRADAERFRTLWGKANGRVRPRAPEMDAVLHRERLAGRMKRCHPIEGDPRELPQGTMIVAQGAAFLILAGAARPWHPGGYGAPQPIPPGALMLTPPATVNTLRAGYRPILHPSALPMAEP